MGHTTSPERSEIPEPDELATVVAAHAPTPTMPASGLTQTYDDVVGPKELQ